MGAPGQVSDRLSGWLERTRLGRRLGAVRMRPFPDRWSGLTGHTVVISFAVVLLSGVVLLVFYSPSTSPVVYEGAYAPLHGVVVSEAFASTMRLSFDVPGGLLMRQLHGWASSLMIAALLVHILRVYLTGAFRRIGGIGWVLLFAILFASMGAGITGVTLPDDLLSGSSLAVLDGLLRAVPFVGTGISAFVFGGAFPSGAVETFFPLHVVALPLMLVGLGLRAATCVRAADATRRPLRELVARGGGARALGWASRHLTFVAAVTAVLVVIAATVTINPVWLYGPADPGNAVAGAGAVWYLAFLDGAQRLLPPGLEFAWLGRTWTVALLVPLAASGAFFAAAIAYPRFEAWVTGDRGVAPDAQLPQGPRATPTRTGIGVAGMTFYGVLWAAASADTIAVQFRLTQEGVIFALQLALLLGPVAAFTVAKRVCLALQRRDRDLVLHGVETGRVVRLPGGEYLEVHAPLAEAARARILGEVHLEPIRLRPHRDGRIRVRDRARAALSAWFAGDRVEVPVTSGALAPR